TGAVLRRWNAPMAPLGADGHELILVGDAALLLGREQRTVDTRPYDASGVADARALGTTIEMVRDDGHTFLHWSALDRIGLDEADPDVRFDPGGFDPVGGDSLAVAP